jgi:hypothetical protein
MWHEAKGNKYGIFATILPGLTEESGSLPEIAKNIYFCCA